VDAVLEGTVRRAGDQLRISAELTRVSTGLGLWSDSYNRKVTDVFAVQEELARAIATTLSSAVRGATITPTVSVAKSRGTENQEAYDLYLRGRYLLNARRELSRAVGLFENAGRRDSSFAQSFAGVASADVVLPYYEGIPAPEALRRARIAATRALVIDSTLAEPHAALGLGLAQTFAWDDAEREFKRAIALDSTSATAYHLYGFMLIAIGRAADALPLYERAIRLDPLSPVIAQNCAVAMVKNGRTDDAFALGRRLSEMDSASPMAFRIEGRALQAKQDWIQAAHVLERLPDETGSWPERVYAYAKVGRRREADSLRAVIERHVSGGGRYADVSRAYAALGDGPHALQWLESAIDRFDGGLLSAELPDRPEYDFLRNDPRFIRLLARMGLGSQRPSR
jgi:serine/threonine-protein kinase